jgi:Flp pilus assembly protein TadG
MPVQTSLKSRLNSLHLAAHRRGGQRGVSAIEFALIAPLMMLLMFGAAEVSQAVSVDRKVTLAASTLGDLAAQTDRVTCTNLAQIANVTRSVFQPYTATNPSLVVASVALDAGTPKVEWSQEIDGSGGCANVDNSHTLKVGNTVAVDTGLFATDGGVVVGEVTLQYTSLGTSFLSNTTTMRERFYFRPRKSAKLCLTGVTTPGC